MIVKCKACRAWTALEIILVLNNDICCDRAEIEPMPKSGVVKRVSMAVMPEFVRAMSMTCRVHMSFFFFKEVQPCGILFCR